MNDAERKDEELAKAISDCRYKINNGWTHSLMGSPEDSAVRQVLLDRVVKMVQMFKDGEPGGMSVDHALAILEVADGRNRLNRISFTSPCYDLLAPVLGLPLTPPDGNPPEAPTVIDTEIRTVETRTVTEQRDSGGGVLADYFVKYSRDDTWNILSDGSDEIAFEGLEYVSSEGWV